MERRRSQAAWRRSDETCQELRHKAWYEHNDDMAWRVQETEELDAESDKLREQLNEMRQEAEEATERYNELRENFDEMVNYKEDFKLWVEEAKEEIANFKEDADERRVRTEELAEHNMKVVREEYAESKKERDEQAALLALSHRAMATLKLEISELQEAKDNQLDEFFTLQERFESSTAEREILQWEVNRLTFLNTPGPEFAHAEHRRVVKPRRE